jgi:hypothetical protein
VHLSYRIASTGRGTGRDDAVDFRKILGREHDVCGAHILLKMLARFAPGIGAMKTPARFPWAIGHAMESWASVAFFLRAMASSAEPSLRFFSILTL